MTSIPLRSVRGAHSSILALLSACSFYISSSTSCCGASKSEWANLNKFWARFVKKAYSSFTFRMYVILIFEAFIEICLCSFSELERYKVNTTEPERNSFYFAVFFALICPVVIFTVLAVWLFIKPEKSNMKRFLQRELYEGIKPNRWARLQPILFLVRRAVLWFMIAFGRSLDRLMFMGLYSLTNFIHWGLIWCIRPFNNVSENITEIGNEMFMAIFCLFLQFHRSKSDWTTTKTTIFYWTLVLNNILYVSFSIAVFIYTLCIYKKKSKKGLEDAIKKISPKKTMEMQQNIPRYLRKLKQNVDPCNFKRRNIAVPAESSNSCVSNPSNANLNRNSVMF